MMLLYSGLLHISRISKGKVESVNELLKIGEEVKVLVVKSVVPDRIALRFVLFFIFFFFFFINLLS
jgi:predicted RNA-binding protein with RPS1 domain